MTGCDMETFMATTFAGRNWRLYPLQIAKANAAVILDDTQLLDLEVNNFYQPLGCFLKLVGRQLHDPRDASNKTTTTATLAIKYTHARRIEIGISGLDLLSDVVVRDWTSGVDYCLHNGAMDMSQKVQT